MASFSSIVIPAVCGMLAHCTPLHEGPGVSWLHVLLWAGLLLGAAALGVAAWVSGAGGPKRLRAKGGVDDRQTH